MKFGLQLVNGPQQEPLGLEQAKAHLRVDFNDDDNLILALIRTARELTESLINRAIFSRQYLLTLDQFPYPTSINTMTPSSRDNYLGTGLYFEWNGIKLPVPRVISVDSITYLDDSGQTQTLDSSSYATDLVSEPARIVPAHRGTWPYPNSYVPGSIKVTFTSGTWTEDTLPGSIQQAMLLLIGHLYANREAVSEKTLTQVPLAVDYLLAPYKFHNLAV